MEQQKIANFMAQYGKYFPADKRAFIEEDWKDVLTKSIICSAP